MSDELTADERAWLHKRCGEPARKLLRLYDAALARAEKAERNMNAIGESWRLPCERAESRLAEATATLDCVRKVQLWSPQPAEVASPPVSF